MEVVAAAAAAVVDAAAGTAYENGNENGFGAEEEKNDFACACNSSSVGTAGVSSAACGCRSSLNDRWASSGSRVHDCAPKRGGQCWRENPRVAAATDLGPVVPDQRDFKLFRGSLGGSEAVVVPVVLVLGRVGGVDRGGGGGVRGGGCGSKHGRACVRIERRRLAVVCAQQRGSPRISDGLQPAHRRGCGTCT